MLIDDGNLSLWVRRGDGRRQKVARDELELETMPLINFSRDSVSVQLWSNFNTCLLALLVTHSLWSLLLSDLNVSHACEDSDRIRELNFKTLATRSMRRIRVFGDSQNYISYHRCPLKPQLGIKMYHVSTLGSFSWSHTFPESHYYCYFHTACMLSSSLSYLRLLFVLSLSNCLGSNRMMMECKLIVSM